MPGVEEVIDGHYRRTVRLARGAGIIDLALPDGVPYALLRLRLDDPRDLAPLVRRCRRLLDLDADPAAIAGILQASPLLAPLVTRYPGLRVTGSMDGWETAARTILGQQVSVAGARTLASRLAQTLGEPLPEPQGMLSHLFPGPQAVLEGDLSPLKLNRQREVALRALARAVLEGDVVLDSSGDREETVARLLQLPGVGPWTASYIAMRVLRDPDAFPAGDLGLRRAFERMGLPGDRRSIEESSEAWRPWRAYAVMYLWKSLEEPR
jgi:AraC family transcriptional regulator of adaptative response / DNA-3-methyladenine glycosylase II